MATDLLEVGNARFLIEEKSVTSSVIDVSKINFQKEGSDIAVNFNGNFYKVGPKKVIAQIRENTGVHFRALEEFAEDRPLHQNLIRHSLERRKGKEVRVVYAGDQVLDFLPGNEAWMSPLDVFDSSLDVLGDEVEAVESIRWDKKDRTAIRFILKTAAQPPKRVNDMSHAGVLVRSNGEVEVAAYVLRLVCTNGLLRDREVISTVTMDTMQSSLVAKVNEAMNNSEKLLNEFIALDEVHAPNPATFMTHTVMSQHGSDRHVRQLMEALPSLPQNSSYYDLVNVITATAKETGNEVFEWYGAHAIEQAQNHHCAQCSRPLRN